MSEWGQQSTGERGRRRFKEIADRFNSAEEVAQAMRAAQVESTDLIMAVDFTYSNIDNGELSFGGTQLPH
jgi:E3 ubiquitin-protein ligase RGLG